jgi:hypothetical protein
MLPLQSLKIQIRTLLLTSGMRVHAGEPVSQEQISRCEAASDRMTMTD